MNDINEALLNAWLRLNTNVSTPRLVSELTYNESLVCNILYQHTQTKKSPALTATTLCSMTNMLKSQMNRTLNQLEAKKMITRERSTRDKRQVLITMNDEQCHAYEYQHARIMKVLDAVIDSLGVEKAKSAIALLNDISDVAEQLNKKNNMDLP